MSKWDKFKIEIKLGNDAMRSKHDVSEAIIDVASRVRGGCLSGRILDINGNLVGNYEFIEEKEPVMKLKLELNVRSEKEVKKALQSVIKNLGSILASSKLPDFDYYTGNLVLHSGESIGRFRLSGEAMRIEQSPFLSDPYRATTISI